MIRIAAILTCFNRREKTVNCLKKLFSAQELYNEENIDNQISLSLYVTDDACTDGTAEAVAQICHGRDLCICKGDGKCYWAGGMRLAWREAQKRHTEWDFYLLLNDDTLVFDNVFDNLLECHSASLNIFRQGGLYSGITCSQKSPNIITYGGKVLDSSTKAWRQVKPSGTPQLVDNTQANILMVHRSVVDSIGILHEGYVHGCADEDYSMSAKRQGFPVYVSSTICGYCENDHLSEVEETKELMKMSFKERKLYVNHPLHLDADYLLFIRRNLSSRYLVSCILRKLRLYMPSLYYQICIWRGIY